MYGVEGFSEASIVVGEFDAANFLRSLDGGLAQDTGGGRYRCAQSKAVEQLFWEGKRDRVPRPITLWLEPVIGVATLARIHYDLGWPQAQLGMQTADYAFDLAVYSDGTSARQLIACEVKKSRLEVDGLVADLQHHSRERSVTPISPSQRHRNSIKKWGALRRHQPYFLWIVGPGGYGFAFELRHTEATTTLHPVDVGRLSFTRQD